MLTTRARPTTSVSLTNTFQDLRDHAKSVLLSGPPSKPKNIEAAPLLSSRSTKRWVAATPSKRADWMTLLEQHADGIRSKMEILKEQVREVEEECKAGLNWFGSQDQITEKITVIENGLVRVRDDINGLRTRIVACNPTERTILQNSITSLLQECKEVIEKLKQIQGDLLQSRSRIIVSHVAVLVGYEKLTIFEFLDSLEMVRLKQESMHPMSPSAPDKGVRFVSTEKYQQLEYGQTSDDVINKRAKDIEEVEKEMISLNQLFKNISNMVIQQGEKLNNILLNIHQASEDTRLANKDLEAVSVFFE